MNLQCHSYKLAIKLCSELESQEPLRMSFYDLSAWRLGGGGKGPGGCCEKTRNA